MSNRHYWTKEEEEVLCEKYPHVPTKEISELLGVEYLRVYDKARRMGLKKSDAYLQSMKSGRLKKNDTRGKANRFKKGNIPWNKGKRFNAGENAKQRRFRRGELNGRAKELYKPLGHERVNKNGILERKIKSDGPSSQRWKSVHRMIFEEHNGPIPDGHIVVFIDGNRRNFDICNLECISKKENMRRNTVHNLPKELADIIQLKGVIQRKINDYERKNK